MSQATLLVPLGTEDEKPNTTAGASRIQETHAKKYYQFNSMVLKYKPTIIGDQLTVERFSKAKVGKSNEKGGLTFSIWIMASSTLR